VNFERFTERRLFYNPGIVKLWEPSGRAGGLPLFLIKANLPGLKALFMSGNTENLITKQGILDYGTHFIQKPFTIESLSRKVRQVLDQ
jgi:hypothetical protein